MRRDPITLVGLAVFAAVVLPYLIPVLSQETLVVWSEGPLLLPLCLWTAIAALSGFRRISHPEERRFWTFIGVGFLCWAVAMAVTLLPIWERQRPLLRLVYDTLVMAFVLSLILATTEAPHRVPGWSRAPATQGLVYSGAALFGVGMMVYFDLVPYLIDRDTFQGRLPAYFLFLALDATLIFRSVSLFLRASDRRWRFYYGLLLSTAALLFVGDALDALVKSGIDAYRSGTAADFVWYLTCPLLAVAARLRFLGPEREASTAHVESRYESPLFSFALLVPLIHFSFSSSGMLGEHLERPQKIVALVLMIALLTMLRWHEAKVEAWNRQLELDLGETRERLASAEKLEAVGRLAGGIAHDFNTKLSVILGYTELLEGEARRHRELAEPVAAIRNAAEHSAKLTANLLAIARRQFLFARPTDVNATLAKISPGIQRTLGDGIRFELIESLRPVYGLVDETWLERALTHLATNSREAMPGGGRFRIECSILDLSSGGGSRNPAFRPGRYVGIEVADDGPGVDVETLSHLFEPFFTTKGASGGRGLGLASVRGIVEQCGGFVTVESQLDCGFTCKLHFPRADPHSTGSLEAPPARA